MNPQIALICGFTLLRGASWANSGKVFQEEVDEFSVGRYTMGSGALAAISWATPALKGAAHNGARDGAGLASVDGKAISSTEVNKAIATDLAELQAQIYELKKNRLNGLIHEQ